MNVIQPQLKLTAEFNCNLCGFCPSSILTNFLPLKIHLCPTCHLCRGHWAPTPSTHTYTSTNIRNASLQKSMIHVPESSDSLLVLTSSVFIFYPTDSCFHILFSSIFCIVGFVISKTVTKEKHFVRYFNFNRYLSLLALIRCLNKLLKFLKPPAQIGMYFPLFFY